MKKECGSVSRGIINCSTEFMAERAEETRHPGEDMLVQLLKSLDLFNVGIIAVLAGTVIYPVEMVLDAAVKLGERILQQPPDSST